MTSGTAPSFKVRCSQCAWRGRRVFGSPNDVGRDRVGFPPCPKCHGTLTRQSMTAKEEKKAANARHEMEGRR